MTTSTTIIGDNMSPKKKLSKLFKFLPCKRQSRAVVNIKLSYKKYEYKLNL